MLVPSLYGQAVPTGGRVGFGPNSLSQLTLNLITRELVTIYPIVDGNFLAIALFSNDKAKPLSEVG